MCQVSNQLLGVSFPINSHLFYLGEQIHHHHHRHKEKKKKKKKDKKKSHDKDHHEYREHKHHHKKKRKREYATLETGYYQPQSASPEPPVEAGPAVKRPCMEGADMSPRVETPSSRPPASEQQKTSALAKLLEYLLIMLEKKDVSNFFGIPVSDTFAPGYSTIIREPMDFSTMRSKIEEGGYENLEMFKHDFELICTNCMTYNGADTPYYKAAKKLLPQGLKILAPERLKALAEHLPILKELTVEELGFELAEEFAAEMSLEDENDVSKVIEEIRGTVRRPPGRFEAIPDDLRPDEIAAQARAAAKSAASRLSRRKPGTCMGFLRQQEDGTTSLSILTPGEGIVPGTERDRPVSLEALIGKVKDGTPLLEGAKEDRRDLAKLVHPLYYGAYSSHGPTYDSTFANLTKEETELIYSTYGDDVGVAYAESIKNFSKNCEYATFIVDHLLDILTGNEHRKTSKLIEEQKLLRSEEAAVSAFSNADSHHQVVDFHALKSLQEDGIDMSFLDSLQKQYGKQAAAADKLQQNAKLIDSLKVMQHERLSLQQPQLPSGAEVEVAERVQSNLADMIGRMRPHHVASVSSVRQAMGIATNELPISPVMAGDS